MPKHPEQLQLPFGGQIRKDRPVARPETSAQPTNVVDLAQARRWLRPEIRSRQDVVGALVGQLAALVRGTTTADRAGEVRKAASRALDLFEAADRGKGRKAELGVALKRVEDLLKGQHN
jgi:hypothetical protein